MVKLKAFSVIVLLGIVYNFFRLLHPQLKAFSLNVFTIKNGDLSNYKKSQHTSNNRDLTKTFLPSDSAYWTILMTVNNGYLDFFLNWLLHLNKLGVRCPLIVLAHDEETFNILRNNHTVYERLRVVRSDNAPIQKAQSFGSREFNSLVSERPQFILNHLTEGRNVLYVDVDTVWVSSPFPYLTGEFDLWMQQDGNRFCTGFMAIKNNNKTLRLIEHWRDGAIRANATLHDQQVFNKIIPIYIKFKKLYIQRLDNKKFPDGYLYFDQYNETGQKDAVVVHNNFIIGHDQKLTRFRKHGLWLLDSQHYPNITV